MTVFINFYWVLANGRVRSYDLPYADADAEEEDGRERAENEEQWTEKTWTAYDTCSGIEMHGAQDGAVWCASSTC